jgi:hypothetical protein
MRDSRGLTDFGGRSESSAERLVCDRSSTQFARSNPDLLLGSEPAISPMLPPGGRAGGDDARDTKPLELEDVGLGDGPADDDPDVVHVPLL